MARQNETAGVSVVMPAYRAETTIARAVRSVLSQTHGNWELVIVADDETDYEAVLGHAGIADRRIRHFSTGADGSGSPPARNLGLRKARFDIAAILDADDAMSPQKLARALPHLGKHGVVSSALRVEAADGHFLRTVGAGSDRILGPGAYKFINISMDSMLVYDRKRSDPRFDPGFSCLTDIVFLLRLLADSRTVYHIGTPQHVYTKQPASVSNKPGAGDAMIATKKRLIEMIGAGGFPLADPGGSEGLLRFYTISLQAEQSYGARLAGNPALLFEDHLEPLLAGAAAEFA